MVQNYCKTDFKKETRKSRPKKTAQLLTLKASETTTSNAEENLKKASSSLGHKPDQLWGTNFFSTAEPVRPSEKEHDEVDYISKRDISKFAETSATTIVRDTPPAVVKEEKADVVKIQNSVDLKVDQSRKSVGVKQVKRSSRLKCPVKGCKKRFSTGNPRRGDHMRKEHGAKKLLCQFCEASYFSRDGMNKHIRLSHKKLTVPPMLEIGNMGNYDKSDKTKVVSQISQVTNDSEVEVLDMEIF